MLAVLRGDCKDVNAQTNSQNAGSVCLYCESLNKNTVEKKIQENPLQNKVCDNQNPESSDIEARCTFICQDCYDKLSLDRHISERKSQEKMAEEIKTEKSRPEDVKQNVEDKKPDVKDKTTVSIPAPMPDTVQFTKTSPNDMYRKLLPAVLFVLTFVTVMTMLLIYMDTVALGAQQFRLNMSRDYELANIDQRSPMLIQYVRQLHLAPRAASAKTTHIVPHHTDAVHVIERVLGKDFVGTFVEFLPSGPRSPTTQYLESVGWDGLVVRAAATDHLAMRGTVPTLNACLSSTTHPREITYHSTTTSPWFSPRVLCLPLATVLSVSESWPRYVLLQADNVAQAVTTLPGDLTVKILEIIFNNQQSRTKTTENLLTRNYTIAANFTDSVVYVHN